MDGLMKTFQLFCYYSSLLDIYPISCKTHKDEKEMQLPIYDSKTRKLPLNLSLSDQKLSRQKQSIHFNTFGVKYSASEERWCVTLACLSPFSSPNSHLFCMCFFPNCRFWMCVTWWWSCLGGTEVFCWVLTALNTLTTVLETSWWTRGTLPSWWGTVWFFSVQPHWDPVDDL